MNPVAPTTVTIDESILNILTVLAWVPLQAVPRGTVNTTAAPPLPDTLTIPSISAAVNVIDADFVTYDFEAITFPFETMIGLANVHEVHAIPVPEMVVAVIAVAEAVEVLRFPDI